MHYVYKITNQINQKCYIGITHNIQERWNNHRSDYSVETIKRPLYKAFQKYGKENFTITTLYECSNEEEAKQKEIESIKELKSLWNENGYNISEGGSLPTLSQRKDSSERMKNSNPMKVLRTNKGSFKPGQKPIITNERNEKIRISKIGENNPNFGNKEAAKHLHVNVVCEHCSKSISKGNYHRWHGSNCKLSVTIL
jgi:group I intron endonuclease